VIKIKTIGIIGSRRRNSQTDFELVKTVLLKLIEKEKLKDGEFILCSGGCPKGGDRFAEQLAKDYGLSILIHYPNWNKYGRGAGFVRNTKIADDSDFLIACVAEDRKGGTENTISKFHKKSSHTKLTMV